MPLFLCALCGRKVRCEYEVSRTGDARRNVEKPPECSGKPVIETIDQKRQPTFSIKYAILNGEEAGCGSEFAGEPGDGEPSGQTLPNQP